MPLSNCSAVGDGAGPHLAARHAAGPKRFIPSVTAAEEDRIIRENAGIAHRLENILAKPAGARPRGVSEGVPFDRVRMSSTRLHMHALLICLSVSP